MQFRLSCAGLLSALATAAFVSWAPAALWARGNTPPPNAAKEDHGGSPSAESSPEASEEARKKALPLFQEGIAKFDGGYYQEAIALFEKAYAVFPSPRIHTRIALSYKWLGNNLKALEYYEKYLDKVRGTPDQETDTKLFGEVEAEVKALLQRVAQIRIICEDPPEAEIRVNGQRIGSAPLDRTIRLAPGDANVTAMASGHHPFKRDIQISGGQLATVRVTLIAIKPKVVREIVHVEAPWYKRWWIWTTVGVVVAVGATGAGLGAYYSRPTRDMEGVRVNHDSLGVRF